MLIISFITVPPAFSGDWFGGYDRFVGNWKKSTCKGDKPIAEAISDISISATESRGNAVNVYFLNSNRKKTKLFFSTSPSLTSKGSFKVLEEFPFNQSIHVRLMSSKSILELDITSSNKNTIAIKLNDRSGITTCEMIRY
jgi:hypothetical protein